jgi:hypothetical protein
MKQKPIRVEWDALEEAFSNPLQDAVAHLDRITGRIVLEGEGEDDDLHDEDAALGPARAAGVEHGREDPTRLTIRPPDTARKIEWLKAFLARAADEHPPEVVAELTEGMVAADPAPILRAIFYRNPEVRDAWWVYRSERVQERIDAWLAEHGVETTTPPPWR